MRDTNATPNRNERSSSNAGLHVSSRYRIRRRILITAASITVVGALAVTAMVWLGAKADSISEELRSAANVLPELKAEVARNDASAAADTVEVLKSHTSRARAESSDPLWTLAAAMPFVGSNFQAVSEVAISADDVTDRGILPLIGVIRSLDWTTLAPSSASINLRHLSEAKPTLVSAAQAVRQSSDRLNSIDTQQLLPELASPLVEARLQLASLSDGLDTTAEIAMIGPKMLGADAPRTYLLLVQNNAESRATGGIPGALAVLHVNKGKLSLESQSSATAMGTFTPAVDIDPEQETIFSTRLGKFMQDVNLTPHFPAAALTAQTMWERKMGGHVDGVLSIDPVALAYVLEATGPVNLTDPLLREIAGDSLPTELHAGNVVPTLLSHVYAEIPEPEMQDVFFAGVANEVFTKLSAGGGDAAKFIDVLTQGAAERRVLLWSSIPDEQAVISQYPIGGSVTGAGISPSQFGLYFNDGTGAKMDYYIKRTVQLVEGCPADGYGQVTVRVTSTNTAPTDAATSLPEYVTGGGAFGVPAGTVQTNIVAYGPVQSNVESVVADGKKISFASQSHGGRPVGTVTVALPPGKSSTIEFLFDKIVQHTEPELSVTPTVQAREDVVLDTVPGKCVPVP